MSRSDGGEGRVGAWLATMLVAGGMIGSGVYLLPVSLAAIGSISILGWLVAIAGAAILAGVFSWLTILRPGGAGLFSYIREAFGPGVGFIVGVLYWMPIGNVPIALAVTGYLGFFVPALATGVSATICTVSILWLLVGFNLIGPRFVARFGGWALLIGLAPILAVAVGGWFYFHPAIFAASWNVSGARAVTVVPRSAVIAFWAFTGIENAVVVAPLLRDPARSVPAATFGGLAIAAVVYLSACGVIMGILPASTLAKSSAPFADAAAPLLGAWIAGGLALCAMLKSAGSLGSAILVTAETAESDAVLGQILPGRAARRPDHPPKLNLILTGVLMSLMVVASASPSLGRQFTVAIDISVVLCMLAYLAACLALLRFSASVRKPWRALARVVATAGALFCCGAMAASEIGLLVWTLGAIAVALLAWLPVRLRKSRLVQDPRIA